jgi:Collagen triple helix repeat (20 copies)
MLSPLRNRFGIPGVISVIALVFAMLGGAYAANDSGSGDSKASASAVKKGPRGPRGPKGPAGPAGAQGPAGPQGAKGDTGATGKTGATGPQGPIGPAGADGTFSTDPLPPGEVLSGAWMVSSAAVDLESVSISFPIQVDPAPQVHYQGEAPVFCPGTAAAPEALPGHLCVYKSSALGTEMFFSGLTEVTTHGAALGFSVMPHEESGIGAIKGTWMVRACDPDAPVGDPLECP